MPDRIGRFELHEQLGAGGMGVVYRAHDSRLQRDVALKVLADGLAADADAVRRFEQEARAASSLNHPNIVTVFDAGTEDGTAYIVTELLQGMTLRQRIAGRPLSNRTAMRITEQVAAALAAAHAAGIVHRDVKPQNIFVTRADAVKLLDFGVARLARAHEERIGDETRTVRAQQSTVAGTPGYMAPEQIRGGTVDARTDLFGLGCVLHEMLTGKSPFERPTAADVVAAVLSDTPVRPAELAVPLALERIVARCLEKDPAERFQSAADLRFALQAAGDALATRPATRSPAAMWVVGGGLALAAVAAMAWVAVAPRRAAAPSFSEPVVVRATTVVSAASRPVAPAISPDGKWVTYIGLAGDRANVFVQFLNGGAPVNITETLDLPLQTRTIVGGIDVLPDGSGITVAGRPNPIGLFKVPGIWILPAPLGGPPRRLTERYSSVRWSPDGTQLAAILGNPLVGDAVAVAAADGQGERILVPAAGGVHLHHVTWGHDGRYIYFSKTLEPNHALGEIFRVPSGGGAIEPVVTTQGTAMFPAATPDGRAIIYAGDRPGEGLNLWWHPLDGAPERRLTTGPGEFTEPYIAHDGRSLVALARRRRAGLVRVNVDAGAITALKAGDAEVGGDSEPSISAGTGRLYFVSTRSGRRTIWSVASDGKDSLPLMSGPFDDRRPVVSPDGRRVAFLSNRDGSRAIWLVSSEGGMPSKVVSAPIVDYVSWSGDGQKLVYAEAGPAQATLWTVETGGGAPVRLSGENARVPAWSPVADAIAFVALIDERPFVHLVSSTGTPLRQPIPIDPVSLPTAVAWSPDGTRLALVNLPGRAAAEAWVLEMQTGQVRKLAELPAPAEFEGVTWTPDGKSLVIGRVEYDAEILLLELASPER